MGEKKDSLLDQDIDKRFAKEREEIHQPNHEKQPGKAMSIFFAILLAIVVLSGIIYPLLQH